MGIILNVKIYNFFQKNIPFYPHAKELNKVNICLIIYTFISQKLAVFVINCRQ